MCKSIPTFKNIMKIYQAIGSGDLDLYDFNRVLISYFYFKKIKKQQLKKLEKLDVFVDSGAFSAWSQGDIIDVEAYMLWLWEYGFETYASLDVIYDPEATKENFETMRNPNRIKEEGFNPIPTFHYGIDFKYLEDIKDEPYIALGGMVPLAKESAKLQRWLDKCFEILIDNVKKGMKVHGFGLSNMQLLKRYPFYSVDSSSWNAGGKFGETYEFKKGRMVRGQGLVDKMNIDKRDYIRLNQKNIYEFQKAEKFLTDLWTKRGIKF